MSIDVRISCLVTMAVFGGVICFPEQQLLMGNQSKETDISNISQEVDLERCRRNNGKNRVDCIVAGGKWQLKSTNCTGKLLEGRQWCSFPKLYVCCVPPPPGSCVFGDKTYPNGTFLEESCHPLQCMKGSWIFQINAITADCGHCSIGSGSDHLSISTYEPHNVTDGSGDSAISYEYTYSGIDNLSFTQPGLNIPEQFYMHIKFDLDPNYFDSNKTIVDSAIYYEPGITVEFQNYKVFVNGVKVIFNETTSSDDGPAVTNVIPFSATSGTVLVYEIAIFHDSSCRVLVGSKGLSIQYCFSPLFGSTFLIVSSSPSLKYQLNGLCDVYTGGALPHPECYIDQNGNCQSDTNIFADSWQV